MHRWLWFIWGMDLHESQRSALENHMGTRVNWAIFWGTSRSTDVHRGRQTNPFSTVHLDRAAARQSCAFLHFSERVIFAGGNHVKDSKNIKRKINRDPHSPGGLSHRKYRGFKGKWCERHTLRVGFKKSAPIPEGLSSFSLSKMLKWFKLAIT